MEFGWEFANKVRIFLSVISGVLLVFGANVWFSYSQKDDPKERVKSCVRGLSMIFVGFAIVTSYHYANKSQMLPAFMYLYEPADSKKAASDKKAELKKAEDAKKADGQKPEASEKDSKKDDAKK